ncbi:MAG: hypothetical protein JJU46_03025 [Balneolaceae bacterium]|nr:hypothetical protein [Balneolaceae bacterium]MCH8547841.1 hypothetical protein [Balneolaceae bacterium]
MKVLYSQILLLAFMVGAIQPVLPLIEYHLFQESIMELFCENRNVPESDCDGICYLTNQLEKQERQSENFRTLTDYYPGTILAKVDRVPFAAVVGSEHQPFCKQKVATVWSLIDLPPPRIS